MLQVKILVTQVQILCLCTDNIEVPWPKELLDMSQFFSFLNADFISITTPCVSFSVYLKMVFTLTVPFGLGFLCVAYITFKFCGLKFIGQVDAYTASEAKTTFVKFVLKLIFIIYPACAAASMQIFVCAEVNGEWYLKSDYRLFCFDDQWWSYAYISIVGL